MPSTFFDLVIDDGLDIGCILNTHLGHPIWDILTRASPSASHSYFCGTSVISPNGSRRYWHLPQFFIYSFFIFILNYCIFSPHFTDLIFLIVLCNCTSSSLLFSMLSILTVSSSLTLTVLTVKTDATRHLASCISLSLLSFSEPPDLSSLLLLSLSYIVPHISLPQTLGSGQSSTTSFLIPFLPNMYGVFFILDPPTLFRCPPPPPQPFMKSLRSLISAHFSHSLSAHAFLSILPSLPQRSSQPSHLHNMSTCPTISTLVDLALPPLCTSFRALTIWLDNVWLISHTYWQLTSKHIYHSYQIKIYENLVSNKICFKN